MSDDRVYLTYILECIVNVQDLARNGREAFEAARHNRAAALYYLQTMAETTQRLSDTLKAAHPEVDWIAINGFRNRLAHGYLSVDMDVVWSVIENYLPDLKQATISMLKQFDEGQ